MDSKERLKYSRVSDSNQHSLWAGARRLQNYIAHEFVIIWRFPARVGAGIFVSIAIAIIFLATTSARAQENPLPDWARAESEVRRHAFVLALQEYEVLKDVPTAVNDGRDMKISLAGLGFRVDRPEGSQTRTAILDRFDAFVEQVASGDTVLFYFSGHGFERYGRNYIAPADLSVLPENRIGHVAISMDYVLSRLEERAPGLLLLVIDACRTEDVPVVERRIKQAARIEATGFVEMKADIDTTIVYAAQPRGVAYGRLESDPPDSASLFTRQVTRAFMRGDTQFYALWPDISKTVFRDSGEKQKPWLHDNGSRALGLVLNQNPAYRRRHDREWEAAALAPAEEQPSLLKTFAAEHPDSRFLRAATSRIVALGAEPSIGERRP